MSETQTSVICPSCDEYFLVDVVDITAHAQLAAAQARIAELEAQHAALHDALRTMGQAWLTLALSFVDDPRRFGEAQMLKGCADDLARTFDAVLAGVEPAKE